MFAYRDSPLYRTDDDATVLDSRTGIGSGRGLEEHEGCSESLRALDGEVLAERFRSWVGASGRRYIFSVFDPADCPAYCGAVLIAARVEANGARRAIHFADTGDFPEPTLANVMRACSAVTEPFEFHLHLLANAASERRSILEDLRNAARNEVPASRLNDR